MSAGALDRFQHLYQAASMRDDYDKMTRLDDAWDRAVDEKERAKPDGYTDDDVAGQALDDLDD